MKKAFLALGILLIGIGMTKTAYAGSLNENEAKVMDAAQGVFVYNGEDYRLDNTYVNIALEYMMSDDIDLTKAQSNEILQSMNSYVESGVKDGYLVPIPKSKDETTKNNSNSGKTAHDSDQTKQNTEDNAGKEASEEGTKPAANITPTTKTTDQKAKMDNLSPTNANDSAQGDFFGGLLSSAVTSSSETKVSDSTTPTDQISKEAIIKNTGFNLNITVVVAVLMGVLMLVGMVVTVRNDFFARSDE